jgi:hypothetical protein
MGTAMAEMETMEKHIINDDSENKEAANYGDGASNDRLDEDNINNNHNLSYDTSNEDENLDLPHEDDDDKTNNMTIAKALLSLRGTVGATTATSQVTSSGGGDDMGGRGGGAAGEEEGDLAEQLQPPPQAYQALVCSGAEQSTSSTSDNNSTQRDLDYALRLTATTLPDHLICGICHKLAKMAMLVPWDAEGRPTCESCIHDGLVKGGYTCPLTGMEGVSPDDLFPNVALRKAVVAFELDIMAKMELIEKQIAEEVNEEEEKRKKRKTTQEEEEEEEEDAERKRMHRDSNDFDEDDRSGRLTSKRRQKGTAAKKRKSSTNVAGSIEALKVSFQL